MLYTHGRETRVRDDRGTTTVFTSQGPTPDAAFINSSRLVMAEFFEPSAPVYSDTGKDRYKTTSLRDLLPKPFGPDDL